MRLISLLLSLVFAPFLLLTLSSCMPNDPYRTDEAGKNIFYSTFGSEPKHLDPARAYSEDEYEYLNQIYEPVIQYHYLKRPYTLIPLTAESMPKVTLFDKAGKELSDDAPAEDVAKSVYEIHVKRGIRYQEHACFAKNPDGSHRWHLGPDGEFPEIDHPDDLPEKGSRELNSGDYIYQLKRLANPALECPIAQTLFCIEGFEALQQNLAKELQRIRDERRKAGGVFYNQQQDEKRNPIYLDMRKYDLPGVQAVDEYTFRITLNKKYPQLIYWLAMPFMCPVPWEAERFYVQAAAAAQNISIDRFPVGTGPYTLAVNKPNYRMVLRKNANYHDDFYPLEGEPEDEKNGLLADKGKKLPFIEEAVYTFEKESAPRWNKFLQGYYDTSGIDSDMFDQAVQMGSGGEAGLTDEMIERNIRLETAVAPSISYYAFNMLDDVVGGLDEKKAKLRQAISIALNEEEFIQIYMNGRGLAAQGPVPPGIFGYVSGKEGINTVVYDWDDTLHQPRRKSIAEAKKLMAEAGYPDGCDASGKQLVIFFDTTGGGGGSKAYLDWIRQQFSAIGVDLQVRSTDYNRFQEKALKGNFQFLGWGWNADYPDPENFLFLLYGQNAKVKNQGENAANYANPKYDELFKKMEDMSNTPERQRLIDEMVAVARHDAPWVWGEHKVDFGLYHEWYKNAKPMLVGNNALKYKRVDPALREKMRQAWNQPVTWPVWLIAGLLLLGTIPAAWIVYQRERGTPRT